MKRFALTISLAACLVFALGSVAFAANSVVIESKGSFEGSPDVSNIYLTNDVEIRNITLPIVVRDAGTYPSALAVQIVSLANGGRLGLALEGFTGGFLWENRFITYYDNEDGTCKQGLAGGFGTITIDGAAVELQTVPSPTDPDAFLIQANRANFPNLPVGTDGAVGSYQVLYTCPAGGPYGDFIIDTTCSNPANHLLMVDDGGNPIPVAFTRATITCQENACPGNLTGTDPINGTVGSPASNQIGGTDPEGDTPIEYFMVSGKGDVGQLSGLWTYTPVCADYPGFDVQIEVTDKGEGGCGTIFGFHVNVAPTALVPQCSNVTVHWGEEASQTISASGGCAPYEFTGGAPGAVGLTSGDWTYQTGCQDLGTVGVTVTVDDAAGQSVNCDFDLTVTNSAPVCTDPANKFFGTLVETSQILGPMTDVDGDGLTYILQSGPTGGYILDNEFIWERPDGEIDDELVVFTVSDGCEESDPCDFYATFEPFGLEWTVCVVKPGVFNGAEGEECDQSQWTFYPDSSYITELYGRNVTAAVHVEHLAEGEAGGFDFLICYDQSALTFLGASRGPGLLCGWEYFTWRTGLFGGNCGGACPDGYIRLVGIADMNDGHDLDPSAGKLDGWDIAYLTFFITQDVNFVGTCPHISFCSFDCTDNVISSKDGNFLALPYLTDNPGWSGGVDYPVDCADLSPIDPITQQPKAKIARLIRFCASAICVGEPDDDRGDMNLNGIPNEIGDAVVYSNYFIQGGWGDYDFTDVREFASDINNDGLTLTIADLVYLIRIITGDEQPFTDEHENPKVSPYANAVDVITDVRNGSLTVRTNASVDLGGALLVYRYSNLTVGAAEFNADGMVMRSQARNGELRIVVYPAYDAQGSKISSGLNDLLTIPVEGNGTIDLVESQFSDLNGAMLSVQAAKVAPPTSYALHQNFPNPFNAGTVIPLSLKNGGEWNLTIYNVAGQVVRTFSGADEAGTINVRWDGRGENGESVASGMYFYRATADEFTATKKMVVLK